jgi:hemerythrin-like domain-containing protein
MKRDPRLHGLTSDHHHALVLALRIKEASSRSDETAALLSDARRRFREELLPHFAVEEEELLPALARKGRQDLVDRTLTEHAALQEYLFGSRSSGASALPEFAALLEMHVRFEERELFPACEALLESEVLERVALKAPKDRVRRH